MPLLLEPAASHGGRRFEYCVAGSVRPASQPAATSLENQPPCPTTSTPQPISMPDRYVPDVRVKRTEALRNTARAIEEDTEKITLYVPLGPTDLRKALRVGMSK